MPLRCTLFESSSVRQRVLHTQEQSLSSVSRSCLTRALVWLSLKSVTWYTPLEMAKRIGFYHSCQAMGSMLAGALQAAILKSLDGQHGLAGWRWTFIINGKFLGCVATRTSSPF